MKLLAYINHPIRKVCYLFPNKNPFSSVPRILNVITTKPILFYCILRIHTFFHVSLNREGLENHVMSHVNYINLIPAKVYRCI